MCKTASPTRSIRTYRFGGVWAFDDIETGLCCELLIRGADKACDKLLIASKLFDKSIVTLTFSGHVAPPAYRLPAAEQVSPAMLLEIVGPIDAGNLYRTIRLRGSDIDPADQQEAWLCPALLKYFDDPPRYIQVMADPVAHEEMPRTGLLDSNGSEVRVGDVLKCRFLPRYRRVVQYGPMNLALAPASAKGGESYTEDRASDLNFRLQPISAIWNVDQGIEIGGPFSDARHPTFHAVIARRFPRSLSG